MVMLESAIRKGHSWQDSAKLIQEQAPTLWKLCYPRMYKNADQYGSPKVPALTMAVSSIGVATHRHLASRTVRNVHIATMNLLRYHVPTYFLRPDFLEAVAMTVPPKEMRWDTLNLPFEAAIFMLPNGWLNDPRHGPCAFIGYSRNQPNEIVRLPQGAMPPDMDDFDGTTTKLSFCAFTACHTVPNFPVIDYTINAEETPYVSRDDFDAIYKSREIGLYDTAMTRAEQVFASEVLNLAFRILLVLEARPRLITHGSRIGTHKKHRELELWTPNLIGASFTMPRHTVSAPTGLATDLTGHPRFHWHPGYVNRYRTGPRNAAEVQYVSHWIPPHPRGGRWGHPFTDGTRKVIVNLDPKLETLVAEILINDEDGAGWRRLPRRDVKYEQYATQARAEAQRSRA